MSITVCFDQLPLVPLRCPSCFQHTFEVNPLMDLGRKFKCPQCQPLLRLCLGSIPDYASPLQGGQFLYLYFRQALDEEVDIPSIQEGKVERGTD